jgi:predicted permease
MRESFFTTRTREEIGADNRAELDAWIDERVSALVEGGVDPDEARRRALEEFGDVAAAARYADGEDAAADRRVRVFLWIGELASDLRIAARTLARTPAVTAVILSTFALGIGAATAVFSVVHAMLIRPLPYGDESTLVQFQPVENGVLRPAARYSAVAIEALRERTTSFVVIGGVDMGNAILMEGDPEQVMTSGFTTGAFDALQARAAIGRTFADSEEGSPVVVLLDGLWRRRFGADPNIVGRSIEIARTERLEVIGVMPPDFRVPTYEAAELIASRNITSILRNPNSAQVRVQRLFARLKPGVSVHTAQADVDRVMGALQTEFPRWFGGIGTRLVPIRTAVAGDARPRLLILMGASLFVLLIACANVAGILLSRAMARRHELWVRVALGAGRRRLLRQFLAEGVMLAIVGAAVGIAVADRGIAALRQIVAPALPAGTVFTLEPRVLLFAIATAIAVALIASLVPALAATRETATGLRRGDGRTSASRAARRMRLGLVATQVAVSIVLLMGAGLLIRTLHRLSTLDVGYAPEHVLTFRPFFTRSTSAEAQDAFHASMYEQLRSVPGVVSVGGGNIPMMGQSTLTGLEIEGRLVDRQRLPEVRYTTASDDYFDALGIPLVRGRRFAATDRSGAPPVAVVSVTLAKQLWPDGDPIGARVRSEPIRPWSTIVGIVGDVRSGPVDAPVPSLYTSQRQDRWPGTSPVALRAEGDPTALFAAVRQAMKRLDPTLAIVGLRTLDDLRRSTPPIAERRVQMQLLVVFAIVALAVSAIGVYGVSAYATEARRREFGIRMALGASQRHVLWLALGDGFRVAILGAVVGVPTAALLASRLREMLYTVAPFDPVTVISVLGALILVVLAASLVPARQAALVDAARTMRTE